MAASCKECLQYDIREVCTLGFSLSLDPSVLGQSCAKRAPKETLYAFASQGAVLFPRQTLDGKINRESKRFYYLQQLLERISITK